MKAYPCIVQRYAFIVFPLIMVDRDLSLCGNTFHLNERTLGQVLDSYCRTAWVWSAEELGIHLVHSCEVPHVREEYCCLYNVAQVCAGSLEDVLGIGEALSSLFLYASFGEVACGRVYGQLSRCEYKAVGLYAFSVLIAFMSYIIYDYLYVAGMTFDYFPRNLSLIYSVRAFL